MEALFEHFKSVIFISKTDAKASSTFTTLWIDRMHAIWIKDPWSLDAHEKYTFLFVPRARAKSA